MDVFNFLNSCLFFFFFFAVYIGDSFLFVQVSFFIFFLLECGGVMYLFKLAQSDPKTMRKVALHNSNIAVLLSQKAMLDHSPP